jgi:hypothetical protein
MPAEFALAPAGVDQAVVVLPPELDAAGVVSLALMAEKSVSNAVDVVVAALAPPVIAAVSLSTAPPGATIAISGANFAAEAAGNPLGRNQIILGYGSGQEVSFSPTLTDSATLMALIPPIYDAGLRDPYAGPVLLCVQVDGVRSCAQDGTFAIAPPLPPSLPPGQTFAAAAQQFNVSQQSQGITGNPDLDQALVQALSDHVAALQSAVDSTLAGAPPTMTIADADGQPVTLTFDVDLIQRIESILAAGTMPSASSSARMLDTKTASGACTSPDERDLIFAASNYDFLEQDRQMWDSAIDNTVIGAIAGACLVTIEEGCIEGAAAVLKALTLPTIAAKGVLIYKYVLPELVIAAGPNYMSAAGITAVSGVGRPGKPVPVDVFGVFQPGIVAKTTQELADIGVQIAIGKLFGKVGALLNDAKAVEPVLALVNQYLI